MKFPEVKGWWTACIRAPTSSSLFQVFDTAVRSLVSPMHGTFSFGEAMVLEAVSDLNLSYKRTGRIVWWWFIWRILGNFLDHLQIYLIPRFMRGPLLVFFCRTLYQGRSSQSTPRALGRSWLSVWAWSFTQIRSLFYLMNLFSIFFCFTALNIIKTVKYFHTVDDYRAQDRLRCGGTSSDDEDSDNKEASMQLIQLDISRTFPHLCIFQKV